MVTHSAEALEADSTKVRKMTLLRRLQPHFKTHSHLECRAKIYHSLKQKRANQVIVRRNLNSSIWSPSRVQASTPSNFNSIII
jgi:hypothetical protein